MHFIIVMYTNVNNRLYSPDGTASKKLLQIRIDPPSFLAQVWTNIGQFWKCLQFDVNQTTSEHITVLVKGNTALCFA